MSLLGSQVYANPSTPIWLSAGGGQTMTAPLIVKNKASPAVPAVASTFNILSYGGEIVAQKDGTPTPTSIQIQDPSGLSLMRFTHVGGASFFQSTDPIQFTQVNQGSGNSSLAVSAAGSNADVLTIGGTVSARNLDLLDAGAGAVIGRAQLTNGTVTVNTTACDVTSYIILSRTDIGSSTAIGELRVSNKGANDFTVVSATPGSPATTETGDESTFDWMIVNAA